MLILEYEGKTEDGRPQYTGIIHPAELTTKAQAIRWLKTIECNGIYHILPDRKRVRIGPKEVKKTVIAAEEID